ncbi:contractile injection system protein, VgrG/Pvc8 family, partial [Pseudomonas viridiflava]|uniref:contractile injection system protein, VgrG/Pvc8 family n=1 Tax=Pseudomonas viridiflava TaxID=33069 RepID=UPI002402B4A5
GYISEFGLQGSDGGIAHYRAILSPWLWMLSRRVDSRIFQDQTIEDVLRKVFTTYGALADFEFHVSQLLTPHSYITQYRENDLDFVLRLMEHEGLF